MSVKSIVSLAAFAALAVASAGRAQEAALPQYQLDMTLYDGARIVGKPALTVSAWTANKIEVASPDGSHYRADFTVEPMDGAKMLFVSRFEVTPSGQDTVNAQPMVEVEAGKPTFFFVGRDEGDRKQFRAEMTIRQTNN